MEPGKMTLAYFAKELNVELWKAMELVKYGQDRLREELIEILYHPEKYLEKSINETEIKKEE